LIVRTRYHLVLLHLVILENERRKYAAFVEAPYPPVVSSERPEDRACCHAELVVLGVLAGLGLCGADQGVVARGVLRCGRLLA
jgi:hypothetical protein